MKAIQRHCYAENQFRQLIQQSIAATLKTLEAHKGQKIYTVKNSTFTFDLGQDKQILNLPQDVCFIYPAPHIAISDGQDVFLYLHAWATKPRNGRFEQTGETEQFWSERKTIFVGKVDKYKLTEIADLKTLVEYHGLDKSYNAEKIIEAFKKCKSLYNEFKRIQAATYCPDSTIFRNILEDRAWYWEDRAS